MTAMTRAMLYWRTVRYLRPSQVAYQLLRRLAPLPSGRPVTGLPVRGGLQSRVFARSPVPGISSGEISFLNRARALDVNSVDWASAGWPKLWRYNLHYFDYLHWPVYSAGMKARLIDSWIAAHPVPAGDGWEPYPLSLRTVNWIKFWLSGTTSEPPNQQWLDSLATQLAGLESRLEYHLLANHLVKNGKALLFGGIYFQGERADRWLELGLEILASEADEQILPDGGHFERSPMYHCIVLEDYLDVLNLLRSSPGRVPAAAEAHLAQAATRALGFLAGITAGDGNIPLFNDSAFGIAVEPAGLLNYGARVLGWTVPAPPAGPERLCFPDTGYFGYRQGGDSLLIDCGPVGPDYQPGHAHCDTLSYELCVDGQRVVVDSGVYGYDLDERRSRARRTAGHNTVEIDGREQSEIWGAFRVARRARPVAPVISEWQQDGLEFRGAHDGYRRLPDRPVHSRRVRMQAGGPWEVFDLIAGGSEGLHRVANRVHIDSVMDVQPESETTVVLKSRQSGLQLRLSANCNGPVRVESGYHFPEFGLCRDNRVIVMEGEGRLPFEMQYRIERL